MVSCFGDVIWRVIMHQLCTVRVNGCGRFKLRVLSNGVDSMEAITRHTRLE